MTRKKTAQAPSIFATTIVLSALIVHERFRLTAMVAGMRIVTHHFTDLAKLTSTCAKFQLYSLPCSVAMQRCRYAVHIYVHKVHLPRLAWSFSEPPPRRRGVDTVYVCLTDKARLSTWNSAWHAELLTHSGGTLFNFLQTDSRKAIWRLLWRSLCEKQFERSWKVFQHCVCLTDRQGRSCTVAIFLVNRHVLTSQIPATTWFSSGRSRHPRHCRCHCFVCC